MDTLLQLPFMTLAAGLGYVSLLALLVSPALRTRFGIAFEPPAPSTGVRFPVLDTVRGVVALYIVLYQTWSLLHKHGEAFLPLTALWLKGELIYAALSGYLVHRSLRTRIDQPGVFQRYALRRFVRIYPLYALATLVFMFSGRHSADSLALGLASDLFMFKLFGLQHYSIVTLPNLFYTVAFYFVAPIVLALFSRRSLWPLALFGFAVLFLTHNDSQASRLIPFFCAGMVAAELATVCHRTQWRGLLPFLFVVGLGLLTADLFGHHGFAVLFAWIGEAINLPLPTNSIRGIDCALGLTALFAGLVAVAPSWVGIFPLRFLGTIAYSLYIWQGLLLSLDHPQLGPDLSSLLTGSAQPVENTLPYLSIYLPALLFCAAVSYYFLERPFYVYRPSNESDHPG